MSLHRVEVLDADDTTSTGVRVRLDHVLLELTFTDAVRLHRELENKIVASVGLLSSFVRDRAAVTHRTRGGVNVDDT